MDRRERRIKQQKRQKSVKRGFLLFVLAVALFFGLLASPLFSLKSCSISGNVHYSYDEIFEASGIKEGLNLFYGTNAKAVEEKLSELPYVDTVSVIKKYPKSIEITIVEKTEFAVVPLSGRYAVIDKNGFVLRIAEEEVELPYITGVEILSAWEGQTLEIVDKGNFEDALSILLLAGEKDFYFERLEFSDSTLKAYIYYDQYLCKGSADNIIDNMDSIKAMVASQYKENIVHGTIIVGSGGYLSFAP